MTNFYGQFIGFGSGGVGLVPMGQVQGRTFGYHAGRQFSNAIEKYSFTAQLDSVDVANLSGNTYYAVGTSSLTHGYRNGAFAYVDTIERHQFATTDDVTDVGDLTSSRGGGTPSNDTTHGFIQGGTTGGYVTTIDKVEFAATADGTTWGDLDNEGGFGAGCSSSTHGYVMGGANSKQEIQKHAFANDTNAAQVSSCTVNSYGAGGNSSLTHGYSFMGQGGANYQKFAFASDSDASNVGDTIDDNWEGVPSNSADSGYIGGGSSPTTDVIQKFPFASDANTTDWANLSVVGTGSGADSRCGWQV